MKPKLLPSLLQILGSPPKSYNVCAILKYSIWSISFLETLVLYPMMFIENKNYKNTVESPLSTASATLGSKFLQEKDS